MLTNIFHKQSKQNEKGAATAFNKNNSILAISAQSKIKLMQLKCGSTKQVQSF
ncbi:unnamed protein product [Paramecium sonneborni]|uniref:Uncharacterized protein n=1 Tax=Paramecium sonneborni TaxID=65129 RepID=A0A8S1MEG5_9CILI|nr:unnamed protein product [Paramecium sonneborni]